LVDLGDGSPPGSGPAAIMVRSRRVTATGSPCERWVDPTQERGARHRYVGCMEHQAAAI
jgi:hypothetical protein